MSIASEISALNTNLTAAKNAVTAKGGITGDTGLAGLSTEIASIPSGSLEIENGETIECITESGTIEAGNFVYIQDYLEHDIYSIPVTPKSGYEFSEAKVVQTFAIAENEQLCLVQYNYGSKSDILDRSHQLSAIRVTLPGNHDTPVWSQETILGDFLYVSDLSNDPSSRTRSTQHPVVLSTTANGDGLYIIRCTSGGTPTISQRYDIKLYTDYISTSLTTRITQFESPNDTKVLVATMGFVKDPGDYAITGTNYVEFIVYTMSTSSASATKTASTRVNLGTSLGGYLYNTLVTLDSTSALYVGGETSLTSRKCYKVGFSNNSIQTTQLTNSLTYAPSFYIYNNWKYYSNNGTYRFIASTQSTTISSIEITSSAVTTIGSTSGELLGTTMFIEPYSSGYKIFANTPARLYSATTDSSGAIVLDGDGVQSVAVPAVKNSSGQYWGIKSSTVGGGSIIENPTYSELVRINASNIHHYANLPETLNATGITLEDIGPLGYGGDTSRLVLSSE